MLSIKSIAKYNKVMAQLFKNHPLFLGKKKGDSFIVNADR